MNNVKEALETLKRLGYHPGNKENLSVWIANECIDLVNVSNPSLEARISICSLEDYQEANIDLLKLEDLDIHHIALFSDHFFWPIIGDLYVDREYGIYLTDEYLGYELLTKECLERAAEYVKSPITSKARILKEFVEEWEIFKDKFSDLLIAEGWRVNNFYFLDPYDRDVNDGNTLVIQVVKPTEDSDIVDGDFDLDFNILTGKLEYTKYKIHNDRYEIHSNYVRFPINNLNELEFISLLEESIYDNRKSI